MESSLAGQRERTTSQSLLIATRVSKRFGQRNVLERASLEAGAGEAVAIVGENGAGKSTLLRICAGLLVPDAGTCEVKGRIGYCPQDPGVLGLLTVDEHLELFGRAMDLSAQEALQAGHRVLTELRFPVADTTVAGRLSGGNRQKLNLALALLGDPDILLLDEPYQGFDHGTYVNFWDLVDAWRAAGRAVIVVTHMLAELTRVDHVVELAAPRWPAAKRFDERRETTVRRWRRVFTIGKTQGLDLLRRHLALVMLISLPGLFYVSVAGQKIRPGQDPWPIDVAGIGVAWAVAGGAFFLAVSSRRVDQRLLLAGYRSTELVIGRLLFLEVFALLIAGAYSVLLIAVSSAAAGPLVLAVVVTALIGVPLGLALAALLPRELEGTLALIVVIGVQMVIPSSAAFAPFTPFYGPLKLIRASWTGHGAILPYVLHGLLMAAGLQVVAMLMWSRGSAVRAPPTIAAT